MTSCCPPPRTRWSGAIGAIARGKRVSIACGRASRSVPVLRWICGEKPTPKAVNKPLHHFILHGLAKPGALATVSKYGVGLPYETEALSSPSQPWGRVRATESEAKARLPTPGSPDQGHYLPLPRLGLGQRLL